MKNLLLVAVLFLLVTASYGQVVRDRSVVPVAVNLNQVLRLTITNGGNIEFTFTTIDDYANGVGGGAASATNFYQTDILVASSTRWDLNYGSETATFIGTDNPANTLTLDNVGFSLAANGNHIFGTEVTSAPTTDGTIIADLDAYPVALIEDNANALASAGDETDNDYSLVWRCGTTEGDMNATAILEQNPSPAPDRYVANVIFELAAN
jgi:hypothetical protein